MRHQEENGGACQVLDESGEPSFGRRIDSVEILDRQDEGLTLTVVEYEVPQ